MTVGQLSAFLEALQAKMSARGYFVWVKADPVVLDGQFECVSALKHRNARICGLGVFLDVGEGFVQYTSGVMLDMRGQRFFIV